MMHDKPQRPTNPLPILLVGSAIGALIALLFAPRSGRENRDMIRKRAGEMRGKAQDMIKERREQADDAADKMTDLAKDAAQKVDHLADDAGAKARH